MTVPGGAQRALSCRGRTSTRSRPWSQTSILLDPRTLESLWAGVTLGASAGLGPAPVWRLQAYLKWMAEGGKDQQLPGLELSYDQLFFINYAQVGALVPTPPAAMPPGNELKGLHYGMLPGAQ